MKTGRKSVGHPVDVATGEVYMSRTDFWLDGNYPLHWRRKYSSVNGRSVKSALGFGWIADHYTGLLYEGQHYYLMTPAGKAEVFFDQDQACRSGRILYNFEFNKDLRYRDGCYYLTEWNHDSDKVERYAFAANSINGVWPLWNLTYLSKNKGVAFYFDNDFQLSEIRQQVEQRSLLFIYDRKGRIVEVRIKVPDHQPVSVVRYFYDSAGLLSDVVDSIASAEKYEYDRQGRVVSERLRGGARYLFKYDRAGRCVFTAGPDGYDAKTLLYRSALGWTEVIDSRQNVTQYQYNPGGQVLMEIDPEGAVFKTVYDAYGRTIETINQNSEETKYGYDERGNRSTIVDALGRQRSFLFNEDHQPLTYTDESGNNWERRYDQHHRLDQIINPLEEQWRFRYDDLDNLIEADLGGARIQYEFTPDGTLQRSIDPEGNITKFVYNAFGDKAAVTGPLGGTKSYDYDSLGRIIKETREALAVSYSFDAAGNLTSIEDGSGAKTQYAYGACGRLETILTATGEQVQLGWGPEPYMLTSIDNPKGEAFFFHYNKAGRISESVGFDGRRIFYEYDPAGRLKGYRDDNGTEITYARDRLGRLVEIAAADGYKATFAYDANGAFLEASNRDVEIRYERDPLGRAVREYQGDVLIEYAYNGMNKVKSLRTDHLLVEYDYTQRQLLSRICVNGEVIARFTRNAAGGEISRSLPHDVQLRQAVDPLGRLLEQTVLSNHGFAHEPVRRTYDWNGLCVSRISDRRRGIFEFSYDRAERLIASKHPLGDRSYAYDAAGNLIEEHVGGKMANYDYAMGDRLLRRGEIQYEHDAAGRLIKSVGPGEDTIELDWDMLNQLRAVRRNTKETLYHYDAFGRRISKRGPGVAATFVWDRGVVVQETENRKVSSWIYDMHSYKPIAHMSGGEVASIICDHLGTPCEMISTFGEIVWSAVFDCWGKAEKIVRQDGINCPIRFQGQWYDAETGFHYSRHRYYDPASKRFISPDPSGLKGGLNPYRYCVNPVNWIDPLGLDWNYVLVQSADDGSETVYYSGVASDNDTPAGVMSRHRGTTGDDGSVRFDDQNGDRLVQVTDRGTKHDTARGLEHEIADEFGTVVGRRGSDTNEDGSVRGNLQNPVDQSDRNQTKRDRRRRLANNHTKRRNTTVRDMVEDAVDPDRRNDGEEGCG